MQNNINAGTKQTISNKVVINLVHGRDIQQAKVTKEVNKNLSPCLIIWVYIRITTQIKGLLGERKLQEESLLMILDELRYIYPIQISTEPYFPHLFCF